MTHRQPVSSSPIIKSFRSSSTIFSIMVVGAGVTLPTKSRWSFTWFSFIISQYKAVICIVTISLTLLHAYDVTIISIIKTSQCKDCLFSALDKNIGQIPSWLTTSIIHKTITTLTYKCSLSFTDNIKIQYIQGQVTSLISILNIAIITHDPYSLCLLLLHNLTLTDLGLLYGILIIDIENIYITSMYINITCYTHIYSIMDYCYNVASQATTASQ